MKTLDEAIKHCEEVAEQKKESIAEYEQNPIHYEKEIRYCKECAEEHRQLAEWLKELKALNENDDVKDVFKDCDTCKYKSIEPDDFPCDRCCHRYINQYVYDDKREVNTNKGVLDKINEKQDSLRATCKAWDEAIEKDGYVN